MNNLIKKTVCIVVTYNSQKDILENIKIILKQVNHVIIIDNKSDYNSIEILKKISKDNSDKLTLILNKKNYGLATAQNQGLKLAHEKKYQWVLFLDQDSWMKFDMVEKMFSYHFMNINTTFIGPQIIEQNVNKENKYFVKNKKSLLFRRKTINNIKNLDNVYIIISSGSLIKLDVFKKIGLFRDGFFIDYIDFEFSLRAKLNNIKISVVKEAILYHKQGEQSSHNIGSLKINCHNYNSSRRYSIARNRIFYLRIFFLKFPLIFFYEISAILFDIFRICFFERNKYLKVIQVLCGIFDGMIKKIPKYLVFEKINLVDKGCKFEIFSKKNKK
ncbi:glycosyltransferase family 2 protein [bacterium]|nr:glycosyltransferase family 2 protein [bacterium]